MTSAEGPSIGFPFKEEDVPKLVFQCCRPDNIAQEKNDSNSASKIFEIFEEALKKKSLKPLLEELHRKVEMVNRCISSSASTSSADENNASDLETEELELLTFAEVLSEAGYTSTLPDSLEQKREKICANRRIPLSHKADPQVNKFFVYTLNKTLVQICDKLSIEDVFAMKKSITDRSNEWKHMDAIKNTETKMVEAISEIEILQSLTQFPAMKDTAFYYLILFIFKSKLPEGERTEMLWKYLEGATSNLDCPRKHIANAVEQVKNYQLGSSPPGLCLIFVINKTRPTIEEDVKNLKNYFTNLKYDVIYKKNPTKSDVTTIIEGVKERGNKFYDSLVVWFVAPGDEEYPDVDDNIIHRRRDLIEPLVDIDWLKAKPKLFFIQALTKLPEEKVEPCVKKPRIDYAGIDYNKVGKFADTAVCHAPICYKTRHKTGSLFIKTILQVLEENGGRVSLDIVLQETSLRMDSVQLRSQSNDQTRQTLYYESFLKKKFIFPAK